MNRNIPIQLDNMLQLGNAVVITNEKNIILAVNEKYCSVTGYSKEEVLGLDAGFLKSEKSPRSIFKSLKEALIENEAWSGVFLNVKKSGQLWHSSITITPIEIDTQYYYIGVFQDLEDLKHGLYLSENKKMEMQKSLLKVLASSCEIRDPGIEEHLLRVQELTEILVRAHVTRLNLSYDSTYVNNIIYSSILHDIGKAGIPEGILYKPGPLTIYERKIVELHPLIGVDLLKKIYPDQSTVVIESLITAENIIIAHHEKWNGTGYPNKLKGEEIPFEARIIAIVDVYDALTSRRPYKDSWSNAKALAYIKEEKGKHFDPSIVETFLELFEENKLLSN